MARSFVRATPDFLAVNTPVVTTFPLTMAAWFRANDITNSHAILSIADKDVNDSFYLLAAGGNIAGDPVRAAVQEPGGSAEGANTTTGYSANVWTHACGVFFSDDSRAAYINGGSRGSDTTLNIEPVGLDRTTIGRNANSTTTSIMDGDIAEAAIWDAALSPSEVLILALGYSPLLVRPQNLVMYVPLIRNNDNDIVGGLSFSIGGGAPGIAPHPKIFYAR